MLGFSRKQQGILHLTWIAFFLTFVAWFNMAPFNTTIMKTAGLSADQINMLMICNVALTIPARIVIGGLVDRMGPRNVFSGLLAFSALVCFYFSLSNDFFDFLFSRLAMGIVGAGFVVGIKMIGEWFTPGKMGAAQGIYAGWGNFGAAAAAFSLPLVAQLFPVEIGWRIASAFSGALCLLWAGVYFKFADELPERADTFKVSKGFTLEVTSRKDLALQVLLMIPLYGAILALIWKFAAPPILLLSKPLLGLLMAGVVLFYGFNMFNFIRDNLPRLAGNIPRGKQYEFSQIMILSLVYALTFGSELAIVSMFPEFLETTFGLSVATAGILGSSVAFMNLITRPSGGRLSDLLGRRRTLVILVLGSMVSYWAMGNITPNWPLWLVILLAVTCSIFIQAGNGACFAMVPLVRKDLTGQMAGLAGAFGNVGAVFFLTALSLAGPLNFFKTIGVYALLVFLTLPFLKSFKEIPASCL